MDGIIFMKFLFLSWISMRHFVRNSFVQTFFATYNTTVASVEPETKRQSDSCASAINISAGVDVGHSVQGNEASELDGDRQECILFLFLVLCNLC